MMLTTKSRYAVMAIVEVASSQSTRPIKLADISNKQTIPLNYLEQIFLKLKKANIVKSVKGPGGGYCLNVPSESLNIIEIIDAVEENTKISYALIKRAISIGEIEIPNWAYINSPPVEVQNKIIQAYDKLGNISEVKKYLKKRKKLDKGENFDLASISKVLRVNNIFIKNSEKPE